MTNTVLILGISIILVSVAFIPLAEAAVSWNGFLKQVGFGGTQVYEVSGVAIIPEGQSFGSGVEIRCLDGDWMLNNDGISFATAEPAVSKTEFFIEVTASAITEGDGMLFPDIPSEHVKTIGYRVNAILNDRLTALQVPAPEDIAVTAIYVCVSPSSFMTVGGEWQATDTTALIIGYSVLNAYWLAPIAIGIGVGIFLTRNRLQKH